MTIDRRGFLTSSAALVAMGTAISMPASAGKVSVATAMPSALFGPKKTVRGKKGLAVVGHPVAAGIAVDILAEGGNACDAALAAALAQTVLEPHLTSLTGCFSMLYRQADGVAHYLNANVNAPKAPLHGLTSADIATGRGVAVPGFWAGVEAAHGRFGTRPLKRLLAPAIELAETGVRLDPFLWGELFARQGTIGRSAAGRRIFMTDNVLPLPGTLLRQREAGKLLTRLGEEGSRYFYHGAFAEKFCRIVGDAGGVLTPDDFAGYAVRWDKPLEGSYRGYEILAATPPDTGGLHFIESLNMLEQLDLQRYGPPTQSVETLEAMMTVAREVLTAGARYGDPAHYPLPLDILLSKDYATMRYELARSAVPLPLAGQTPPPGSCHLTIVDGAGNIASVLHSTLSVPWVNGLFVDGVSICGAGGHFLRTMPAPGGRVSVMLGPNIILRQGKPVLASGSPSTSLVQTIVQNTIQILDFGDSIENSVRVPRFGGLSDTMPNALWIEDDMQPQARTAFRAKGFQFDVVNPWSFVMGSFEGIHFLKDGMAEACGDPRRTSIALAVN